ncbi:hypothetical protein N7494_005186 [Penicillium frequentans]|uniref:Uncharacterized protein n=1 Tax=Penicillium frequentans TaxID=3151616 RepID=A0AAD6CXQ4_9EURO|nr:hypothetical protein N7494_005186 [Penicillium glabrum]
MNATTQKLCLRPAILECDRRSPKPQTSILSTRSWIDLRKLDGAVRPARNLGTRCPTRVLRFGQSPAKQTARAWCKQFFFDWPV